MDRLEIRRQIENDDPDLDKINIAMSGESYLPSDGDLESDGRAIGRNTHISELSFGFIGLPGNNSSRDKLEAFCRGFAGNKSIERLRIACPKGGEIFNMLGPFFEQNCNLSCLTFKYVQFGYGEADSAFVVSELLSRLNTLREFQCHYCQLCDSDLKILIQALTFHSRLTKISLIGNTDGGGRGAAFTAEGMAALTAVMNNPKSSLVELQLWDCSLNDKGANILAAEIARNSTLRSLDLSDRVSRMTVTGWTTIFTQLQNHSSLENLELRGNSIHGNAVHCLANALINNRHLKALNFAEIFNITAEDWQTVFDVLQSPRCMLQELDLSNNALDDDDMSYLANCLSNNCILRELNLVDNERATALGWGAFSAVLQNPNSALEKVYLGGNYIDDAVGSFANALVRNRKLKELLLYAGDDAIIVTNWDVLLNALCNKSSIMDTFHSNHTLQRICDQDSNVNEESLLPSDLTTLLLLNQENTNTKAARRKILNVHFYGDFNMQPFIDMDLKALPHAIAWMARDEYGSSLLYQFVRYTTLFVGIGGAATMSENEPGTKRQKTDFVD